MAISIMGTAFLSRISSGTSSGILDVIVKTDDIVNGNTVNISVPVDTSIALISIFNAGWNESYGCSVRPGDTVNFNLGTATRDMIISFDNNQNSIIVTLNAGLGGMFGDGSHILVICL